MMRPAIVRSGWNTKPTHARYRRMSISITIRKLARGYTWEVTVPAESPEAVPDAYALAQRIEADLARDYGDPTDTAPSEPLNAPSGTTSAPYKQPAPQPASVIRETLLERLASGPKTREALVRRLPGAGRVLGELVQTRIVRDDGVHYTLIKP